MHNAPEERCSSVACQSLRRLSKKKRAARALCVTSKGGPAGLCQFRALLRRQLQELQGDQRPLTAHGPVDALAHAHAAAATSYRSYGFGDRGTIACLTVSQVEAQIQLCSAPCRNRWQGMWTLRAPGNVDAKPLHQRRHGKKVAFSHGLDKIAMQLQPLSPDLGGCAAKLRSHAQPVSVATSPLRPWQLAPRWVAPRAQPAQPSPRRWTCAEP